MTNDAAAPRRRLDTWLSPWRLALAGLILVVALLGAPITTLGPGDHERRSCGNALVLDLGPWQGFPAEDYWQRAHRSCTTTRVDRLARSVVVLAVTVLAVAVRLSRTRRPTTPGGSRP